MAQGVRVVSFICKTCKQTMPISAMYTHICKRKEDE